MGMRTRTVGILLGATLAAPAALPATFSTIAPATIQVHLNGVLREDLRIDLRSLEVEGSPRAIRISLTALNYRIPPGASSPALYYTEGSTRVALGSLLRITIDEESHECPVTQLDADFPVSQPPEIVIHCQADRLAPQRSAPNHELPLAGFAATVTTAGTASRVTARGTLAPGRGALRVNDMAIIAGAGSLSGIYRLDHVKHTFDHSQGLRTEYQAMRVRN